MSNSLLTMTQITRESLRILHQKLSFIGSINRQYDDRFAKQGAKIGDTLQIRLPNEYTVRTGKTIDIQDTSEQKVDLTMATQKGVDLDFSSVDLTLHLDDFSNRIIEPAMSVLAASIEADAFNMYQDVFNQVNGSGGAMDMSDLLNSRKNLTDSLAPQSNRAIQLSTQQNVDVVDALKGLFQDSSAIAKQYREGMLGLTAGFGAMYENTLIPRHTVGTQDGNYVTNGANQTGSTITVASGTGTLLKGDVINIADVFRVHPETKANTGQLQQFVVTEDYSGGAGDVSISPAIVATGARQNVNAAAGTGKAITVAGTAGEADDLSLAYHRDAFAFVSADLAMPKGGATGHREVFEGISMRIVEGYDINNDEHPCRIDVLYGYKTLRGSQACRIANN